MENLQNIADIDWAGLLETARTTGFSFLMKILVALLIFYVGRMVARTITKSLRKIMQARAVDKILESFICNLAYWAMMVFIIIAAINHLGVQTTSLVAVMGAAGLAIGLAMQGALSNFAAGVLIVIFRPYRVGDFVEIAGVSGVVLQVQILSTILKTPDNKQVIVPNSQVMGSIITNYSSNDQRRVDLTIGVDYEADLDKVRNTLTDILNKESRVLDDPGFQIAVSELADSSVNFAVRPWVKTEDYWAVYFDLTEVIKKRFDEEGISFPFPQQDVHLYKKEA